MMYLNQGKQILSTTIGNRDDVTEISNVLGKITKPQVQSQASMKNLLQLINQR